MHLAYRAVILGRPPRLHRGAKGLKERSQRDRRWLDSSVSYMVMTGSPLPRCGPISLFMAAQQGESGSLAFNGRTHCLSNPSVSAHLGAYPSPAAWHTRMA
jgi:hypothetical protein